MRRTVDTKHGVVEYQHPWFWHDNRRFGFILVDDEGKKFIVSHQRRLHKHGGEFGFHVPVFFVLKRARILFEVPLKDGDCSHHIWDPNKKSRMIYSNPTVFISINRMDFQPRATHIARPRISK